MLAALALALTTAGAAGVCDLTGVPWVPQCVQARGCPLKGAGTQHSALLSAAASGPAGEYNFSITIRHGANDVAMKLLPDSKVQVTVIKGNETISSCEGVVSATCNNISFTSCHALPLDPEKKPTTELLGTPSWCRAWTPGCASPEPPYGQGFAFLSALGSNMVMQQAPSKSAVYGITVGAPTAVRITVTDEDKKTSYEVDAEFNTTHQPFGPEYVGGHNDYISAGPYVGGPHTTWKAFLKPAPAGGNFTISAVCTGCTEDGSFSHINISNVTFG
jgi:hypothetical protein